MFRVHMPIIRSIRCWVAAYGFLHRVFGWMVVLRAAAWVVLKVRMVPSYGTNSTVHTTYTAALKTTTHPKTRCRKPYAETQHLMLPMMGVCTRNMSSYEHINKTTLLHQVGISNYFMRKMHGQTTLKKPCLWWFSLPFPQKTYSLLVPCLFTVPRNFWYTH
jgi:hypothetical protein